MVTNLLSNIYRQIQRLKKFIPRLLYVWILFFSVVVLGPTRTMTVINLVLKSIISANMTTFERGFFSIHSFAFSPRDRITTLTRLSEAEAEEPTNQKARNRAF